jgi:hypothetical protein
MPYCQFLHKRIFLPLACETRSALKKLAQRSAMQPGMNRFTQTKVNLQAPTSLLRSWLILSFSERVISCQPEAIWFAGQLRCITEQVTGNGMSRSFGLE